MPCASRDELPLQQITPSYSARMADWGGMTVGIEAAPAGMDASTSLKGLPDDRCQAHHWGYLLCGRIVVDYGDRQETSSRAGVLRRARAPDLVRGGQRGGRVHADRTSSSRRSRSSERTSRARSRVAAETIERSQSSAPGSPGSPSPAP